MKDATGWWAGEEGGQAVEASLGSGAAHHLLHSQATKKNTGPAQEAQDSDCQISDCLLLNVTSIRAWSQVTHGGLEEILCVDLDSSPD